MDASKFRETLRLTAVNYYHKALHLGCCSSPRSASAYNSTVEFRQIFNNFENVKLNNFFSKFKRGNYVKLYQEVFEAFHLF